MFLAILLAEDLVMRTKNISNIAPIGQYSPETTGEFLRCNENFVSILFIQKRLALELQDCAILIDIPQQAPMSISLHCFLYEVCTRLRSMNTRIEESAYQESLVDNSDLFIPHHDIDDLHLSKGKYLPQNNKDFVTRLVKTISYLVELMNDMLSFKGSVEQSMFFETIKGSLIFHKQTIVVLQGYLRVLN